MTTGAYISGALHLSLILWIMLGGVIFRSEDPDVLDTTNVRLLSETEFLSLTATEPEPVVTQEVEAPTAPATEENNTTASAGDTPIEPAPRPEIAEPADPDAAPEKPDLSIPVAEVEATTPEAPVAPEADTMIALLPPTIAPGRPRDAPSVAPTPTPEAPPSVEEAPVFVPEVIEAPEPAPEPVPEVEDPPAAPADTTTEIVTEADQQEPEGTKVSGFPPRLRPPDRVAATTEQPASEVTPSGETETTQTASTPDPQLPVGPPLSFGEVDQLVAAMERCWRPGVLSTAAAESTVIVAVSMKPDATPIASSIRLIDSRGPDQNSIDRAYETAVRAIRQCGLRGFPLPAEKFAHWAEIEITFSPEQGLLFE